MNKEYERYLEKAESYVLALSSLKPNRRTGSKGNKEATAFCGGVLKRFGYEVDDTPFPCLDFASDGASLKCGEADFEVLVSPYSLGCEVSAELITAKTVDELKTCDCRGKILLLHGDICNEQLMPKNFSFYNPESHKLVYSLLEEKSPLAIITATKKNAELVGAMDPFPLIEDGDFDLPSVYCTDKTGKSITEQDGGVFELKSNARRISSSGCNIIAEKQGGKGRKVVVCAHIDAYGDSPGASDNASGVAVLMLLGEMLNGVDLGVNVELVAFNGEDNYSAAGQKDYLKRYSKELKDIELVINIDDVGYKKGKTAFSLYNCPDGLSEKIRSAFKGYDSILEGEPWYQSDHMIFVQKEISAIAITSEEVAELMATITHTGKDTPDVLDYTKVVDVAYALKGMLETL